MHANVLSPNHTLYVLYYYYYDHQFSSLFLAIISNLSLMESLIDKRMVFVLTSFCLDDISLSFGGQINLMEPWLDGHKKVGREWLPC